MYKLKFVSWCLGGLLVMSQNTCQNIVTGGWIVNELACGFGGVGVVFWPISP